ncbi:hypothetical protein RFI02_02120 [Acinetobacter sichuanensis]|uniref:hypothetical protein n=1 Tax=Acinetobacter sichuanensis TaxID=2136183 RepID=UPI00280F3CBF|nr:hypothetical protein [Acinetobacter sichuanensis]MDQ9019896.1 hypothetical protein [Acinetobacter sichuanensis]
MSEIWGYDYKQGWVEESSFIFEQSQILQQYELDVVIKSLGYKNGSEVYEIDDSVLGNPIQLYEMTREETTLPKYLIEYCPAGCEINYFAARNMPSLIELLNKLAPLVQAVAVCREINDRDAEKYK